MSNLININGQENFKSEVLESKIPVLVDFWAPWCGPCQMMGPVLEELSMIFDGKLKISKVNVEEIENGDLSIDYNIQTIPNMKLFKDGQIIDEFIGFYPKETLKEELNQVLE